MCRLGLGLEAPALAWLQAARASGNHEPSQKPKVGLGLAWLWPRPGLSVYMYNFAIFDLKIDTNTFNYIFYNVGTLFYFFLECRRCGIAQNCTDHADSSQSGGFDCD
jgi:hypothetical protein